MKKVCCRNPVTSLNIYWSKICNLQRLLRTRTYFYLLSFYPLHLPLHHVFLLQQTISYISLNDFWHPAENQRVLVPIFGCGLHKTKLKSVRIKWLFFLFSNTEISDCKLFHLWKSSQVLKIITEALPRYQKRRLMVVWRKTLIVHNSFFGLF